MDTQKAELESTIRARRARLDRRLHRLENRIEAAKDTGRRYGFITAVTVLGFAAIGTIALVVRAVRGHR